MIVGIGVDVVDVARFERATDRTPGLLSRLFAESEQVDGDHPRPLRSMAARFAAKEALIKALGSSDGVHWHDMQVVSDGLRNPSFEIAGSLSRVVADRGITAIHLSLSHDGGIAVAYVIAESGTAESGTAESGTAESAIAESGIAESGIAESGIAENGTAESGS